MMNHFAVVVVEREREKESIVVWFEVRVLFGLWVVEKNGKENKKESGKKEREEGLKRKVWGNSVFYAVVVLLES